MNPVELATIAARVRAVKTCGPQKRLRARPAALAHVVELAHAREAT
jgi:hypothetical protein